MKNIGVIDSGLGGLTVLFDVIEEYPNCNYYYVGDSENCPYGVKSSEEIKKLSYKVVKYLVENKRIDILIIACNSISSTSTNFLKEKFPNLQIIETIIPTSHYAKKYVKNNKIGIIATNATINSHAYENNLKEYEIFSKACPIFVNIVENGFISTAEEEIIFKELKSVLDNDIDTLILGCTHFPLLIPTIRKVFGGRIVTSSKAILKELDNILIHENKIGNLEIYTTSETSIFKEQIKNMFHRNEKVNKIKLD